MASFFALAACEKEKSGLVDAAAPLAGSGIIFQDVQSRVRNDNFDPFITTDCDAARSAGYSLLTILYSYAFARKRARYIFKYHLAQFITTVRAWALFFIPFVLFDEDLLKECEMRRFLPSHSIKTPHS